VGVNKPFGDNARKGAVKKRTKLGGVSAWTKRSKKSGEFMAVKKPTAKKNGSEEVQGSMARESVNDDQSPLLNLITCAWSVVKP
jgi:hypothetical protein